MIHLFIVGSLLASCLAYPDAAIASQSFQPIVHARGVPDGEVFSKGKSPVGQIESEVEHDGAESSRSQVYRGGVGQSEPTQTFYVNVPQEQYPAPQPLVAGPPRKHYRIVFIRSPGSPPPQPIIPPRVEQKTLIYVLHPKQGQQQQNVIQVPEVKHDPQVYFIQYEDEAPTAEDLQDLVRKTIETHAPSGGSGAYGQQGIAPAPAPAAVYPPASAPRPAYRDNLQLGNNINPQRERPRPGLSQSFPVRVGNRYQQQNQGPQVIQARPAPRDSLQISQGYEQYQQQPQPKYVRTRSTSSETKTKTKRRTGPNGFEGGKPQARIAEKRFGRDPVEPSDDLKAAFGDNLSRQFRFGSRLKTKRTQEKSNEESR